MTTAVQHRRGTTAEHAAFTGLEGELTIDTTKDTAVIHDGTLAGGYPLAKENLANVTTSGLSSIDGASTASDDKFFIYDQSATSLKTITRAELNNAIEQDALANVAITGGTINGTTIGGTTAAAGAFTTLAASGAVTLSGGTANGVAFLNASKELTTGSALTYNGTNLSLDAAGAGPSYLEVSQRSRFGYDGTNVFISDAGTGKDIVFTRISEQMRLTSTGLGIGTSSPGEKLEVSGNAAVTGTGYLALQRQLIPVGENGFPALQFRMYSTGTTYVAGASISATSEAAWSSTSAPTRLQFYTVPSGSTSLVERMRLDSSGNLGLGVTPSAWSVFKAFEIGTAGISAVGLQIQTTSNTYYNGSNYIYKTTGAAGRYVLNGAGHQWDTAPSGTAGNAISFSQVMTLDASGNLGIGTSSPLQKLQVKGIIAAENGGIDGTYADQMYFMAAGYPGTQQHRIRGSTSAVAANNLFCFESSTSTAGVYNTNQLVLSGDSSVSFKNGAMKLDSSGNLGLGVTPSAWNSSYKALDIAAGGAAVFGGTSFAGIANNSFVNSSFQEIYKTSNPALQYLQVVGEHRWYTAPSGTAGNAISFSQAMTLDASGYLLVGATSSAGVGANRLQVGSTAVAATQILAQSATTHLGLYASSAAEVYAAYATGSALIFGNGPANGSTFTERARIDSSGNLLVGTTSAGARLTVQQSGTQDLIQVNMGTSGSGYVVIGSGSAVQPAYFQTSSGFAGQITCSGTTTSYATSSDYRLKENIAPMTGALAKVAQLKPVTYTWKADGSAGEGFIAHELAEVCPAAVTGEKDAVDAYGKPQYQGIDVSFLVGTLTAAIQELKAEFDAYKASHP